MTANKLALTLLLVAPIARAQGPSASDQTLAQSLFDQGVALMDQSRYAEACLKLAESQRLDPGGGTLLNLGLCRQNEGKLASAWEAYNEALSQAIKDGRKEREDSARAHVKDLDGKLAKLTIDVDPSHRVPGLEVKLDGTQVRQAAWGATMPIDRGEHTLVASAPGKRDHHVILVVKTDGSVQRVAIPVLEDAPITEGAHNESRGSGASHLFGWVLTGVGVAFLGVGIGTGVLAIDYRHQSDNFCPSNQCTGRGVDLNDQAKTFAWLSDFGIGLGVVSATVGVIMIVTSLKSNKTGLRVTPTVSAHGAGMGLAASF